MSYNRLYINQLSLFDRATDNEMSKRSHHAIKRPPICDDHRRTVAEFFAGIGLMRMGLESKGWRVAWANDIDPNKHAMYEAQFGFDNHLTLGDIHDIDAGALPAVALATASFPCTDLSLAGGRNGLAGVQSSAFWAFTRILEDWGDRRPPLVLIENVVPFITSHGGQDFERAMLTLNEIGYSVDPFVIDAARFVPQSRQRIFIVGRLGAASMPASAVVETEHRPSALVQFVRAHPHICWHFEPLPPLPQTTSRLSDIIEDIPDDASAWWNVPRASYLLSQMSDRHRAVADHMIAQSQWSYGTVFRRVRNHRSMAELRVDGIAGCLRTPKGGSARQILFKAGFGQYKVRFVSPRECARLMGADDFIIDVPQNQAFFGFGDAVCVPVVSWIAENYLNALVEKPDSE